MFFAGVILYYGIVQVKNLAICQIYDIILFRSLWKWIVKFCKNKKMAKCNTFVTFSKILGKTYPSNPYKQELPEGQGRNGVSPLKGIDTSIHQPV